jgi:organic radical activating enzyme
MGWLEVADKGNMTWVGCPPERVDGHRSPDQLEMDILFRKQALNCHNIRVAGGEPTVHPQIDEVRRFILDNGMRCVLVAHDSLLDADRLCELQASM